VALATVVAPLTAPFLIVSNVCPAEDATELKVEPLDDAIDDDDVADMDDGCIVVDVCDVVVLVVVLLGV
jgi:hypothetical protein